MSPDVIRRYVLRREQELKACYAALKDHDFVSLAETAHKIIGNCDTFGFGELGNTASELYSAATEMNDEDCLKAIHGLEKWVEEHLPPQARHH